MNIQVLNTTNTCAHEKCSLHVWLNSALQWSQVPFMPSWLFLVIILLLLFHIRVLTLYKLFFFLRIQIYVCIQNSFQVHTAGCFVNRIESKTCSILHPQISFSISKYSKIFWILFKHLSVACFIRYLV